MNFMNAVDTNVFVYALDADEPAKQAKAVELFDRLMQPPVETVLLWQVASEFLNQLRKWESKGQLTATEAETAFQRIRNMFSLRLPTENVFRISFDLRSRFSLSHCGRNEL
jgi:predicted nucleic acid-binding protein